MTQYVASWFTVLGVLAAYFGLDYLLERRRKRRAKIARGRARLKAALERHGMTITEHGDVIRADDRSAARDH